MKKIVSYVLMCSMLLCMWMNVFPVKAAGSAEDSMTNEVISQPTYDGFQLEWMNDGKRDLLVSATNSKGTVTYQYDTNSYLIQRIGMDGTITTFAYNESGQMVSEQYDGHKVSYAYNEYMQLDMIVIDGTTYYCGLDDEGSVIALYDKEGNLVVQYVYSENKVTEVWGANADGVMVDFSEDDEYVGNLNHLTFASYYFDQDTGWYYCGRFFDVNNGRFVDGRTGQVEALIAKMDQLGESALSISAETVRSYGQALYLQCYSDSTFGAKLPYSMVWYKNLSDIDVIVRVIAAETLDVADDETGVAFVLWNRKKQGFASTLRNVATQSGAFKSIRGNADDTYRARTPNWTWASWDRSLQKACYIYAAEVLSDENGLLEAMAKPSGYQNQVYFCSYESFESDMDSATMRHKTIGITVTGIWIPGSSTNYTTYNEALSFYENVHGRENKVNIYLSTN